jgi:hypothetical protein
MFTKTLVRPVVTPDDQAALGALMAEPEAVLSDAPLYTPQAEGLLLLGLLLILSPATPKEPRK